MVLWFIFGFGAAAHMLAFRAAADVVRLEQIGSSAAIVNGTMFLVSGLLIAARAKLSIVSALPVCRYQPNSRSVHCDHSS
jgi:hypothetical protein